MTNAEATTTTETAATVAPEKASSTKGASPKKGAPKGQKAAKAGKKAKPALAKEASTTRVESKGAKILELIGRPKGASLAEIMNLDPSFWRIARIKKGGCMREHDSHERRLRRRFEIQMDLRCKLPDTGEILEGKTYDISSRGVRFGTKHRLPIGQDLQLSLTWPVRLDERWPLQLVVR